MKYVSLFSGIEAASVAWEPIGWEPVAFSEVEPFPCDLLAKRFPHVPNLGDVSQIDWSNIGPVDLVVGGSPCQAFSVAGRREGLMDERGQLMLEYVRAVRDLRPRWLLWENVPGVLSQSDGDAFETLQRELEQCGYSLAWRVIDAQFCGVAQRRRRVFLVGHPNPGCAAAVLFEPESLRWDFASSRAKRESLARDSEICARSNSLTNWDYQGKRIFSQYGVAPTLGAEERRGGSNPPRVAYSYGYKQGAKAGNAEGGTQGEYLPVRDYADCLTAAYGTKWNGNSSAFNGSLFAVKSVNCPENAGNPPEIVSQHGDVAGTLTARNDGSPCADKGPTVVAFAQNTRDEVRLVNGDGKISGALAANPGMKQTSFVCYGFDSKAGPNAGTIGYEEEIAPTLLAGRPGAATNYSDGNGLVVRRLTPTECERLQGFPDGWTDINENTPDTPRYKALGNSMAVPVMRWIGERIEEVDQYWK